MKITILSKTGIQESEKYAIEQIEKKFPKEWRGYASLEIVEKGKLGREVDLVILTEDRILLVELKRWNGQIKSEDGYWYIKSPSKADFESRGASPVKKNNDKARILKAIIERTIQGGHAIFVDSRVVLCGRSPSPILPTEEKPNVLQLAEFLTVSEEKAYARLLPLPDEWKYRKSKVVNPLNHFNDFELLFRRSSHIRARDFTWNNYKVDGIEIFKQPDGLYREYRAVNRDDLNARALLRRWDFSQLGTNASTQGDWVNIAHRESRVFSFVKSKTDDLDGVMLQPLGTVTADDVTVDYCELFELPQKQKRLFEFIETYRGKLPIRDRISLVKVLVAKFAELHRIGVAHRDIGDHCIWLERPDSVRLSGFVAAHFPQMETIGPTREKISSITTKLPEDYFEDKFATSFHRDVFLLGVISHILIFEKQLGSDDDGLPRWTPFENDVVESKLNSWFERTLSWDTVKRWENAEKMLDALNDIQLSPQQTNISLATFEYFKANTNIRDYDELEEPVEKGNLEVFRAERQGLICQVKIWYGLKPDMAKPDQNYALLRFLEKARAIQFNPSPWLPSVIDVGLVNKGVLYAREWLEFPTLAEWNQQEHSLEDRMALVLNLLIGLERLHSMKLFHGDIHPNNILVRPKAQAEEKEGAVFIDTPDFKDGTEEPLTLAYAPANYDRISVEERDRYATVLVICEILRTSKESVTSGNRPIPEVYKEIEQCLQTQPAILTLSLLKESVEKALRPQASDIVPVTVTIAKRPNDVNLGVMLSDNGKYYVESSQRDASHERIFVSGPGWQLKITINIESRKVRHVDLEKLTHSSFQRKAFKAMPFEGQIIISEGPANDADELVSALFENPIVANAILRLDSEDSQLKSVEELDEDVPKQRTEIGTRAIWQNLIEAEIDALPELVVVKPPRYHPTKEGALLVAYQSEVTLEYAPDEQVEVFREFETGESKRVGLLDHRASNAEEVVIIPRGLSLQTPVGTKLTLQSKRDRSSYERRQEAMERILSGRSVISNLVKCFERSTTPDEVISFPIPSDEELAAYDIFENGEKVFSLNEDQKEAFKKLASSGPLCLLQGPPGTGKTSFIGAFLHYIVSKLGAQSILLVSQSHEATNNALEGALRLAQRTHLPLEVVRVGEEGVLSDSIRHVGVSALQESFRERFRSEFKHRVAALSNRLHLSQPFVEEYCQLMLHLGRLGDDIAAIESELGDVITEDDRSPVKQKLLSRKETFFKLASSVIEVDEQNEIQTLLSMVQFALVNKHGVRNPAAVEKLYQLIRISREWVDVLGSESGNFEEFLAKTRTIVAGTCVGVGRWNLGVAKNTYDWVIVDEAARATPSELAVSMQVGRRILLVGDHFQLPPFYKDELRLEVSKRLGVTKESDVFDSDFERAFESPYGAAVGASLATQYRMAPSICSLVSRCFYEPRGKRLKQGRGTPKAYYDSLPLEMRSEVVWVDTSGAGRASYEDGQGKDKSTRNQSEARTVLDVLRKILSCEEFVDRLVNDLKQGEIPIGIIAMYSAQVSEITRTIAKAEWLGPLRPLIKVGTVDSYQGKENRIVIVSLVRHNDKLKQGFLSSPNRLNVAMSRAMDRLVIVGAMNMWRRANSESPLAAVVRHIDQNLAQGSVEIIDAQQLRG